MARPVRLERTACGFEVRRSIQLSYGRMDGVSEGTRTLDHWGHNPVLYPTELHSPSLLGLKLNVSKTGVRLSSSALDFQSRDTMPFIVAHCRSQGRNWNKVGMIFVNELYWELKLLFFISPLMRSPRLLRKATDRRRKTDVKIRIEETAAMVGSISSRMLFHICRGSVTAR